MQRRIYELLTGLLSLTALSAVGQRQEVSISPIGFFHPKNQLVQYERYVDARQSLTLSLGYIGDQRDFALIKPPHTDHFWNSRGAIGYRYYFHSVFEDEAVMLFSSVRAVVDYSSLTLQSAPQLNIPTDSLRASGISLAPEILFGGKALLRNRISLTGAIGMQYYFKLLPTDQITRNQTYWRKINSEDHENWQRNRSIATDFRRGWYPSIQITIGVLLGKESAIVR